MEFVHIADMHFDAPFKTLAARSNLGQTRRLEQRNAFKKVIEYIQENKIPYLFISGDLYEQEYVRESTIEFINNKFKEIENTKVFIVPGNHDPYIKNSYYNNFKWNENVYIFKNEIEEIQQSDVNIYGVGFGDFYEESLDVEDIEIRDSNKLNVLLIHGDLDGSKKEEKVYNAMSSRILKTLGFDYIALGHIHKTNYEENSNIVYPGSTISLGFDELNKHGMIVGDISKENIYLKFVPVDDKEFKEYLLNISNLNSKEELIEKINEIKLDSNCYYKIILDGGRNFNINVNELYKYITNENIIKIKDKTKVNVDLEKISNDVNLKGIFAKELLKEKQEGNINNEVLEKAIQIALEIL